MTDALSPSLILRLSAEAFVSLVHCAAYFEARLSPGLAMVLSGEPFADLNVFVVDRGRRVEEAFRELAGKCLRRDQPFLAIFGPAVAGRLTSVASGIGLEHAAEFPLMVCEPADLEPAAREGVEVVRAATSADIDDSAFVLAKSFKLSEESVRRAFPLKMLENPAVNVFVGRLSGQPVSSVTTTIHDDTVGIWAMGTDPAHQRKGLGRALLTKAMHEHIEHGARRFYLGATPAGRPLYERIGFVTHDVAQAWVAGQTSQA